MVRTRVGSCLAALGVAWLCSSGLALGQVTTADIVGRVSDASGGALPGTTVTVTSAATGAVREVVTNETGDYLANSLPIGRYAVRIELTGFKVYASTVTLSAGDRVRIDASLEVGSVAETVDVVATAAVLQTDSSTVQEVVTERAVQDLPLNGRNYVNLVQMAAGANAGPSNGLGSGNRPDDRRQTSTVSVNGQNDMYNNYMIDGLDNNERHQGTQAIRPSIDAIAEVRVMTNLFTAELGRTAGAAVNVITKSGSNEFKGSAYEFFRDDRFDARDFFAISKPDFRQNQFGGSVGGPVIRGRTFFFADVEWLKNHQGRVATVTVPTAAQREGNFAGLGVTITDPSTGQPFPGNVIPASRFDAITQRYLQLIPLPNLPGTSFNYQSAFNRTYDSFTTDVKLEHRFGDNDSAWFRYSYNPTDVVVPGALPKVTYNGVDVEPGGSGAGFYGPSEMAGHGYQGNYQRILRSNLLAEVKGGYSKVQLNAYSLNYGKNLSRVFGVPGVNIDSLPFSSGLSPMNITGYAFVGDNTNLPILNTNDTTQVAGSVAYTRGAHNFKAGVAYVNRHLARNADDLPNGQATFNAAPTGHAFASFLLGLPQTMARGNSLAMQYMRIYELGAFLQDDWRATSWLTLNLGLRYDYYPTFSEKNDNLTNVDLAAGKLLVASASGDSRVGLKQDYNNLAPRIGFSATVTPTLVIRGGFGITYFPADYQSATIQLRNSPYYYTYTPNPLTVTIAQGYPAPTQSDPNSPRGTIIGKDFDWDVASLRQFNVIVQKDLWGNSFSLGYVGSRGRNLVQTIGNINVPDPSPAASPATRRPYLGFWPNVTTVRYSWSKGKSEFDSLQVSFQRRYKAGLVLNANYTLADNKDNVLLNAGGTNPYGLMPKQVSTYDWGAAEIDVRHRFAASANYELPFGKDATAVKAVFLKGWQINAVGYWQSGLPFTVTSNVARINTTATSDRPNMIKDPKLDNPTISAWFDTTAFAAQALGTAGDEPRNALYGPPQRRIDMSIAKNVSIGRGNLQLRIECYNITNIANFENPISAIAGYDANGVPLTTNGFGRITATAANNIPRQFQFGVKYLF